jgi:THO complex subunit 2
MCRLYRAKFLPLVTTVNAAGADKEVDASVIDRDTLAVLSTFLVPALSLFPSDTDLPDELWNTITMLPYTVRYKLYSAWRNPALEKNALRSLTPVTVKSGKIAKPLGITESEIDTGIKARYVLKRISKENIKEMGSQLAKTSHNNPLVVFNMILSQIESYDNMILMMVDTFQFVTALSLDVMGYCLLLSLGGGDDGSGRSRTKSKSLFAEYHSFPPFQLTHRVSVCVLSGWFEYGAMACFARDFYWSILQKVSWC